MYTLSERTEKKYTVQDALNAATVRTHYPICINVIIRRRLHKDDMITLEQLNDIADELVDDSIFYAL